MDKQIALFTLLLFVPIGQCAMPGTFDWRPRLGLDLSVPTTDIYGRMSAHQPSKDTIYEGYVVMIEGYQMGITIIGFASGLSNAKTYAHLNPVSAYFYTNVYRWALRYISILPVWFSGSGGNYVETTKVWRRRFYYMDEFMPHWMRKLFPYVKDEEWEQEELDYKRFKKYAEPAFGKHFRFPARFFNNFKSQETTETVETPGIKPPSSELAD